MATKPVIMATKPVIMATKPVIMATKPVIDGTRRYYANQTKREYYATRRNIRLAKRLWENVK